MNSISLKFQDKQIETKFQESTKKTLILQFEWLIISFLIVGILVIIIELTNANYLMVGMYCLYVLFYVGFYFYIHKHQNVALKYLKIFNIGTFVIPLIGVLFSIFKILPVNTLVAFILILQLYIPLYNSSYNIIMDISLIFISMGVNIYHLSYLIGFTPYYLILCCPMIQLSLQRYQKIKVERILFSQSLVNQSLVDVIAKVCKENIIIFTYNLEQHKYEKEIVNETAKAYFNTDIVGNILKEIHIKYLPIATNISSFIFKTFILQQQRGEFTLQGYYNSKKNKIFIHFYVTQYLNIQIILKIEIRKDKIIKMNKANKLMNFQVQFLEKLMRKFRECYTILGVIDNKYEQIYNYLRQAILYNKVQILSIAKLSKIKTQSINLEIMIKNIFLSWNLNIFLNTNFHIKKVTNNQIPDQDRKPICSSKMLLEMTLHIVAIIIRKIIFNPKEQIMIELVQSEEIILINFHFTSKNPQLTICFLKNSLSQLIAIIGLIKSLKMRDDFLSFQILRQLEEQI